MKFSLKRETGFFGMGSSLSIIKNGESIGTLAYDSEKEIEFSEGDQLSVKLSILRSEPFTLSETNQGKQLTVTFNPIVFRLYILFFTFTFIFPIFFHSWVLAVVIVLIYLVFAVAMTKKIYLIEESRREA
ncbi:hypothetical protein ACWN8V_00940 [Vagococcus elongatus]|uniref:Uncharacterized protein n=1 Tax=Vagococcus elongatus TaxID=180344 RepID=A0A430B5U9_9ENTE|nr:hypothetical protein [Vagococcus elongatus]RSU15667.1 hypothetical protein CBF29_00920 [Vagococcus elongatus]